MKSPKKKPSPSSSKPAILISGYRGLAETLIESFLSAGVNVSALVRKKSALPSLKRRFPELHTFVGDVTSPKVTEKWIREAKKKFGRIDGVINNAGVTGPVGKLHETDPESFRECLEINMLAPVRICHQIIPHFSGGGFILNVSGGGATAARPLFNAYSTSKTALVRFTENLAGEYPEIAVYALAPGLLKTRLVEGILKLGAKVVGEEFSSTKKKFEAGGEDPKKAGALAVWLFEKKPSHLSGRLISAIWDDYKNKDAVVGENWWKLRRVDNVLAKDVKPK